MNILVSGATGLVGSSLGLALRGLRHDVQALVRGTDWMPETGELKLLLKPDAFIHLAGESIASKRWSRRQKERIRSSRVETTERLARSLLALDHPPHVFVSASAIGYYGDRGEELLTEESSRENGFLSQVVADWEAASRLLETAGIRVVHLRFGMILSRQGGALPRMLTPFKLGLGGPVGNGQQWVSWVALPDVVGAVLWALNNDVGGPLNIVSPHPVRNAEFTRELAKALHRPAFVPVPPFVLRLAFGEMADALLLSSLRVVPARLLDGGFQFRYAQIRQALHSALVD